MSVPPSINLTRSDRLAAKRTVQDRLTYLRLLAAGAFYPAARLERRGSVRLWAEEEELVYADRSVSPENVTYAEGFGHGASIRRLTTAGYRFLLSADGVPERRELGWTFGFVQKALRGPDGEEMYPEFAPDPLPGDAEAAGLVLYHSGWDVVSFWIALEERVSGKWLHEHCGWESHVLLELSPYVLSAAQARRKALRDAAGAVRHADLLRADNGGSFSARVLRDYLLPETVRALDAAYDAWNPCTPAELFRVCRGAGLIPAGNVSAPREGTRRRRLRAGDDAVDPRTGAVGRLEEAEEPGYFWMRLRFPATSVLRCLVDRAGIRRLEDLPSLVRGTEPC